MSHFKNTAALGLVLAGMICNVGASLPNGWNDSNIGSPGILGSADYTNGIWLVSGGGADIWNSADQFNYLTNSLNGDGAIIARVVSQNASDPWAQAGIMFRNDASAGATEASVAVTPGNGVTFRYRNSTGGATAQTWQTGIAAPEFVRLSRSGTFFTASYSADGLNWTQLGTPQNITMQPMALAGLSVTAHNNTLISTGAFTGVYLVPGPQAGTQANLVNPYIGGLDMAWQTTWPLPQLNVVTNSQTPRMGWNSWFAVGDSIGPSENVITNTASSLVADGLASAGYNVVTIDCSWIASGRGYRDTNGDLVPDPSRWPDGMGFVADYVHNLGLLMGGYSDIGASGYGSPAQTGMYEYYQHDADQFASWGWDFIKIDDHGPGDFFAACSAVLNNIKGRPITLSLSTPQVDRMEFANRIANSFRVNNDIAGLGGTVSWSSILWEFDTAQSDWYAQAPGHFLDPDMLMLGFNGINDIEGRSQFNLWCILGAPLMIGADVRPGGGGLSPPITATTINTLTNREVIAVDQDSLCAVGRSVNESTAVYAKPLKSFTSGAEAVLFLNRMNTTNSISVNWSDLGLVPASPVEVRDLWAHQFLGLFTNGFTASNLPPHGSMMISLNGIFDWNPPRVYEGPSAYNTFSGSAHYVPHDPVFSSGAYVTGVGSGAGNKLQFNMVAAPSNGLYEVDIDYACSSNRTALLSVDGGASISLPFTSSGSDTNQVSETTVDVPLLAGTNTLVFFNPANPAPNFGRIAVSRGTPTSLRADGGNQKIILTWSAPGGDASFNLYRGVSSGSETLLASGLAGTNFVDESVTNGVDYYYYVTGNNPGLGGESPPSFEAGAQPRYATTSLAYPLFVFSNNPTAYWRLNESNGSPVAIDAAGLFNGSVGSAVALGQPGPQPPDFLGFEVTNTSAQFSNGSANSWINIPALNLNTSTVTFTAWIYPLGPQAAFTGLVFCRSGNTVAGVNFDSSGSNLGYTWNNDANTWGWSSEIQPPLNQWSFVAVVIQPASTVVYLINTNGTFSTTNAYGNVVQSFAGPATIGTDTYAPINREFNGLMDEVAVFNHALTADTIQGLYENGHQLGQVVVGLKSLASGLKVNWVQGTLFDATNVAGPWTPVANALSPLVIAPTNSSGFFRVLLH